MGGEDQPYSGNTIQGFLPRVAKRKIKGKRRSGRRGPLGKGRQGGEEGRGAQHKGKGDT